ncbi:ribonuclease H-like domain-containing protein [Mycena rebaudengoi]|nr:ribonuclease H-like domain-containing protein [Mycena rebaudengoi]
MTGCVKSVVSHRLEIVFGARRTGAGENVIVAFKSRGPALEEVVTILRNHISGNGGQNVLLTHWVDDLIIGAREAIRAAGLPLPRKVATTAAKRLFEHESAEIAAQKRQRVDNKAAKERKTGETAKAKKRTEQGAVNADFEDLVDDPPPPITATVARGKPKFDLLDRLVIKCHSKSTGKERFRCAGDGCHESWASPRMSSRILPHSSVCRYMDKDRKETALLANAKQSLNVQVAEASSSTPENYFQSFKKAGAQNKADARTAHIKKTNHLVLKLLCDAALAPALVDNRCFRDLMEHLEPANGIRVGSTFSANYIPAEAAMVTILSLEELRQLYNLSAGYDGGTTAGGQSIYTVTVTTPNRVPHLIKGDEASGFSHTGEHIRKVVMEVIDMIGRDRFVSVNSDSTGNTTVCREEIVAIIPTMMITPDPCHHLSNTIKDICKIEYFIDKGSDFAQAIGKMRIMLTYFSHSSYSTTHLKAMRVILQINKGLEKIGKTRFGTLYWASYSLLRCLPPITELVNSGVINVDGADKEKAKLAWLKNLRLLQDFTMQLQQLCTVLEPIARAIKCLEGLEATVGDVWKFYVAITAVLQDLFAQNSISIPQAVQDEVCTIVNRRYKQMIDGPSGDLYLSGFYLDPEHVKSPILFKKSGNQLERAATTPLSSNQTNSGATDKDLRDSMPTYSKIGTFLYKTLAKELQSGRSDAPPFRPYLTSDLVFAAFKSQFENYTRQYPPFSARSPLWSKPIQYWNAMSERPEAAILAFLAIKIFSILPNSMPEERTVSRFTRLDTKDRASQDASTIVDMTKIYQHYRREARKADKLPSSSKSPSMNWRSVKHLMTSEKAASPEVPATNRATETTPRLTITSACEAGLAAINSSDTDEGDLTSPALDGDSFLAATRDGVDTGLPFFRDLLVDAPIAGANDIRSLGNWADGSPLTEKGREVAAKKTWAGEVDLLEF